MFVFDLMNFLLGSGVGIVATVMIPKLFSTASADVAKVEASAKNAANTVANTVNKL